MSFPLLHTPGHKWADHILCHTKWTVGGKIFEKTPWEYFHDLFLKGVWEMVMAQKEKGDLNGDRTKYYLGRESFDDEEESESASCSSDGWLIHLMWMIHIWVFRGRKPWISRILVNLACVASSKRAFMRSHSSVSPFFLCGLQKWILGGLPWIIIIIEQHQQRTSVHHPQTYISLMVWCMILSLTESATTTFPSLHPNRHNNHNDYAYWCLFP